MHTIRSIVESALEDIEIQIYSKEEVQTGVDDVEVRRVCYSGFISPDGEIVITRGEIINE
jgi:hypothetical protein